MEISEPRQAFPNQKWASVYASEGVWAFRLFSKPLVRDIVLQIYTQLRRNADTQDQYSYVHSLARIIDLVHPSQKIQTAVMAYPINAVPTLRKRLANLGYNIGPSGEESMYLDASMAIDYVKQINKRLDKEHRFYFEFAVQHRISWRVGFTMRTTGYDADDQTMYPGEDYESLGIASDGSVFYNGKETRYISDPEDYAAFMGFRTWGILVDLYAGHIALVVDGKVQPPAFGTGASHYDIATQKLQK